MATVSARPGRVEVEIAARTTVNTEPRRLEDLPGGLYPLQTRSYEMDEYRLMAGWPVEPPRYEVRGLSMVSARGEVFADRDDVTAIRTGALLRWVPDADFFDETALVWRPLIDGTGQQVEWVSSPEYLPTLIADYEYRIGGERFIVNALNFDSDERSHMWCDLATTLGGAAGYTVIMLMSPNSVFGNNVNVPYNGLWCPGGAPGEGEEFTEEIGDTWSSLTLQGGYLYLETESQAPTRAISITPELNTNAPLYLAVVFGRPETVFYVGDGPDSMRVQAVATADPQAVMDNSVVLGRSTGDVLHTADMALLDLSIYANRLSAQEVHAEFALLSAAYGGKS